MSSTLQPQFCDVDWEPVIRAIEQADSIILTTHCNPDGDGIGSQLALYDTLTAMGKRVRMFNRDGIPRIYTFLEHAWNVERGHLQPQTHNCDLIISLDSGAKGRLGLSDDFFEGSTLINIDHHASNKLYGDYNLVDSRYCATGAMIFDLMIAMEMPLTVASASAIYTAILTDTASFRLASATASVYRMAADLVDAGAKPWPISMGIYESRPLAGLHILSACLETLEIHDEGRSAWLFITREMYEDTGADVEDSEGLIDYGRSIDGVEVAVLIRSDENDSNCWKVSFRGKTFADVGKLAGTLGGGGHHYAAGCLMRGSFDEVRDRVRSAVSTTLS
ncbi:phosphoesterase RecJ domain-containing protein [Mariprofundus ferrinatatus]|uniref:Phosphoesterase RecJ domain-containing protein n=1 Tax=Mariprofundus ferrinatatus TaxID=1921087 RepID=A0A2K8L3L2_9PROT|nr:DHH family phosphoesterase [Mariprofundus ferrinatatus]ATX81920.1 phosphoesterase RecJ domain-containing protein [Mariprofundus ferrinatatus]